MTKTKTLLIALIVIAVAVGGAFAAMWLIMQNMGPVL